MQPAILDVDGIKSAAFAEYATNFCEGSILQLARSQVMQNEDSDCRRKRAVCEGQSSGIALHDARAGLVTVFQLYRQCMVVFQAGDARCALLQLRSCRARTGTDFQKMIAQRRIAQGPRQELVACDIAPERTGAKPILKRIHFLASIRHR